MYHRKCFSHEEREYVFKKYHYRCNKCNKNLLRKQDERVLDHIIPLSKGGTNKPDNIQLLCHSCDKKKADKILPETMDKYVTARLKHMEKEEQRRINLLLKRKI